MRQVGHLLKLYQDARSAKHKIIDDSNVTANFSASPYDDPLIYAITL